MIRTTGRIPARFLVGAAFAAAMVWGHARAQSPEEYLESSVEVLEPIELHDNVIILHPDLGGRDPRNTAPPDSDDDAGSDVLSGAHSVSYEEYEGKRAVFVQIYADEIDEPLRDTVPGDIVVGYDKGCTKFRHSCGLLGRLEKRRDTRPCPYQDNRQCVEYVFSEARLSDVIRSGKLAFHAWAWITDGDEECFKDDWTEQGTRSGYEESEIAEELECHKTGRGLFPRRYNTTAAVARSGEQHGSAGLTKVQAGSRRCREGDWSRQFKMPDADHTIVKDFLYAGFKYEGLFTLDHEVEFDGDRIESAGIEAAYCHEGKLSIDAKAERNETVELWKRSSGPHVRMIGWLPVVYSVTARLDFRLSARAAFNMNPMAVIGAIHRVQGKYERGNDLSVEKQFDLPSFHWGDATSSSALVEADAVLSPVLQMNLYGLGGPAAGAEASVHGRYSAADSGGELLGGMKVGLESRFLDPPAYKHLRVFECKVGDSDSGFPECLSPFDDGSSARADMPAHGGDGAVAGIPVNDDPR